MRKSKERTGKNRRGRKYEITGDNRREQKQEQEKRDYQIIFQLSRYKIPSYKILLFRNVEPEAEAGDPVPSEEPDPAPRLRPTAAKDDLGDIPDGERVQLSWRLPRVRRYPCRR